MVLEDNITEKYETWSNREMVIAEHLRNLYNAQRGFSTVLVLFRFSAKDSAIYSGWADFLTDMMTVLKQAEIKTTKLKSLKKQDGGVQKGFSLDYDKIHTKIDTVKKMMISSAIASDGFSSTDSLYEYDRVLSMVGQLYDKLGYSSPERMVRTTGILSDIQIEDANAGGIEIQ